MLLSPPDPVRNSAPPARLLLVDRNEMVLTTLSMVLRRNGIDVFIAPGASEALRAIETRSFDVLLVGLHLPHAADGIAVVQAMKRANPRAWTMIVSGDLERETTAAILLSHADEVIAKPIPPAHLLLKIREGIQCAPSPLVDVQMRTRI